MVHGVKSLQDPNLGLLEGYHVWALRAAVGLERKSIGTYVFAKCLR